MESTSTNARAREAEPTCTTSCAGGRHNMPPPLQFDIWPFDLESGVRVACDVVYLCTNFSPRPLCSRLRPDVRDRRQTDVIRQTRRGGGITSCDTSALEPSTVDGQQSSFSLFCSHLKAVLQYRKKKNLFFAQKPNIKMNKHVNKVRKATARAVEPRPSQPVANKINNNT